MANYHYSSTDSEENDDKPCFFMEERVVSSKLDIVLGDDIQLGFRYAKLLDRLRNLEPEIAYINLYLNNFGGYTEGGNPLFHAFQQCEVPVRVHVLGNCYSMGAILALCGTSLIMAPDTFLHFHNFSGSEAGKGKEMLDMTKAHAEALWRWDKKFLSPFLTDEEIDLIKNDQDVYVYEWKKAALKKRIKRHFGKNDGRRI